MVAGRAAWALVVVLGLACKGAHGCGKGVCQEYGSEPRYAPDCSPQNTPPYFSHLPPASRLGARANEHLRRRAPWWTILWWVYSG